jgi:hypothetical protein
MTLFKKFSDIEFTEWLIILEEFFRKVVDKIKYELYKFFI